jgi:signal peptidase II
MRSLERLLLITFVLLSCVGCDQVSKTIARQSLAQSGTISFLNDTLRFQYAENSGAFLSLGASAPEQVRRLVFTIFVGLLLAGTLIYLIRSEKITKPKTIAVSLVLGGGVGNLIDRVSKDGRVIDFLNVGVGSLRSGVFNLADVAISIGIIWLFILYTTGLQKSRAVQVLQRNRRSHR